MECNNEKLVSWLFETKAISVCPEDKPFWYTSGTIGPYYINTHYLYGNEKKANELLKVIDAEKNDIFTCPDKVLRLTLDNYSQDSIYRELIDTLCRYINENIDLKQVDCISGGERRDWFFSLLIAHLLGKPHVTIYKDQKVVLTVGEETKETSLDGMKILHIADLLTEASSYERAWIPAVNDRGGKIMWSLVVVDRRQGGRELLSSKGIEHHSMIEVDDKLFDKALSLGRINKEQHAMIISYLKSPKESMREFLKSHPEFMENSLNADEKTRERASLCLEKNFYNK